MLQASVILLTGCCVTSTFFNSIQHWPIWLETIYD